jgi:site-specific recombinase XerD
MMDNVRWELYPRVARAELARTWLQLQANLQLAPKTVEAYGRCLNDYLAFCERQAVVPEAITREQVGRYVHELATRPNPQGSALGSSEPRRGLANATLQQRLTVLRLFCDYLVEQQLRPDNPVGRGHYVPGKGFGGARERGLLPHYQKLPWIPSDAEWQRLLAGLRQERLRNQVMLLLAYEGALRREELVTVEISDFDFAYRQIRIRAAHAKNGRERVVSYGSGVTSRLLEAYLRWRRRLSPNRGPLFLSESRRNPGTPLSPVMWSKIVAQLAQQAELPQFTTHTPRHLRLTHLARAKLELHQIALYAGHKSLQTTMQYIHLSGVELTEAVTRSLAGFEGWIDQVLEGASPS